MSVDAKIVAVLDPFGHDVDNSVSFTKDKTYFAFNYSVIPEDFADDAPQHERFLVQVHFFCPLNVNITKQKKNICHALFAAGFTWPEITDASDENGRHIVFECEIAEGVDSNGNDDDKRT